jgi:glutaminyl-tRNA synthetase
MTVAPKTATRLGDRLLTEAQPDAGGKDFIESLNPDSLKVVTGYVEPSRGASGVIAAKADDKFRFERHGYFVADREDHATGNPVSNRVTGLKDSWGK